MPLLPDKSDQRTIPAASAMPTFMTIICSRTGQFLPSLKASLLNHHQMHQRQCMCHDPFIEAVSLTSDASGIHVHAENINRVDKAYAAIAGSGSLQAGVQFDANKHGLYFAERYPSFASLSQALIGCE